MPGDLDDWMRHCSAWATIFAEHMGVMIVLCNLKLGPLRKAQRARCRPQQATRTPLWPGGRRCVPASQGHRRRRSRDRARAVSVVRADAGRALRNEAGASP